MADEPKDQPTTPSPTDPVAGGNPTPAVPPIAAPGQETAVDPAILANQPAPAPAAPALDVPAGVANDVPGGPPMISPERIDALKKNLAYLFLEALDVTGLPIDTLLAQVFRNAAQQGLAAEGRMIDFGAGQGFAPTQPILKAWLDSYFDRALANANGMAEQ